MRQIIFRGKRIDNGEWTEVTFLRVGIEYSYYGE